MSIRPEDLPEPLRRLVESMQPSEEELRRATQVALEMEGERKGWPEEPAPAGRELRDLLEGALSLTDHAVRLPHSSHPDHEAYTLATAALAGRVMAQVRGLLPPGTPFGVFLVVPGPEEGTDALLGRTTDRELLAPLVARWAGEAMEPEPRPGMELRAEPRHLPGCYPFDPTSGQHWICVAGCPLDGAPGYG